jgi:hypothetical protein
MPFTPGLWRHRTRRTTFALCVDDFGVKYFSRTEAMHLINALHANYQLTIDWTGNLYCGLTLDWHYDDGYVDISMPGYVDYALKKIQSPKTSLTATRSTCLDRTRLRLSYPTETDTRMQCKRPRPH